MRQAADSLSASRAQGVDRSGTIVAGRFRLETLLGHEGGTEVYQAIDGTTGSPHAVRIVPVSIIATSPERLIADVSQTQALRHKNLVEVEAAGIDGDVVYVASELVDGQTLREFIDAKRAEGHGVSLKGACNLVAHVSNALDYASRLVRHGALNPGVVWVNRAGRVKVSGLAIAPSVPSFARHGAPAGGVDSQYVAPEVLAGQAVTAQADVYSLGMIFYELLTGNPPGTPFQPASRLVEGLPSAVDSAIGRALSPTPQDRWPTPTALKEALQQAAGTKPASDSRGTGGVEAPGAISVATTPAPRPRQAPAVAHNANAVPRNEQGQPAGTTGGAPPTGRPMAPALGVRPSVSQPLPEAAAPTAPNPDDAVERWLIHKDKLDFGPFSMLQIRAQIERGEIQGDHLMIDSDTGTKCRVRDMGDLGLLSKNAHRRLEQARRAQAEQRSEQTQKKKSVFTGILLVVVVVALAGAAALFLLTRRDTSGGHLASREEEAEIDTFLKGVKIGLTKATVRRGAPGAHHGGGSLSGGDAADFNNDANFGDVGKGFYQGDQTLDDDQIQNTMMGNYRKLIPCIVHNPGVSTINLEFAVRGNGKVSAVKVNGQRTGALPACMLSRMQSFSFPKFNGAKTIASWSMSMGR